MNRLQDKKRYLLPLVDISRVRHLVFFVFLTIFSVTKAQQWRLKSELDDKQIQSIKGVKKKKYQLLKNANIKNRKKKRNRRSTHEQKFTTACSKISQTAETWADCSIESNKTKVNVVSNQYAVNAATNGG